MEKLNSYIVLNIVYDKLPDIDFCGQAVFNADP